MSGAPKDGRRDLWAALRDFRVVLLSVLDALARTGFRVPRRQVALTLRLDAMGDFFIWLQSGAVDVAHYVRGRRLRSVLLANKSWAPYARTLGLWDEVIDVDPIVFVRNPFYRFSLLRRIRRFGACLLIQPRPARVFLQEDAMARASGADCVGNSGTALNTSPRWRKLGDRSYGRLIGVARERATHETIRNEDFVRGLTARPATPYEFAAPTRSQASSDAAVVVVLGAGWSGRVWPVRKLQQLLQNLHKRHPTLRVELLGTQSERAAGEALAAALDSAVLNLVGRTDLHDLVARIAAARLVICNDSGAFHVAMAYARPVVCFLGGGHYGAFAPYPANRSAKARVLNVTMDCYWCYWHCKYPRGETGAVRCVESIDVQIAQSAVDDLLSRYG